MNEIPVDANGRPLPNQPRVPVNAQGVPLSSQRLDPQGVPLSEAQAETLRHEQESGAPLRPLDTAAALHPETAYQGTTVAQRQDGTQPNASQWDGGGVSRPVNVQPEAFDQRVTDPHDPRFVGTDQGRLDAEHAAADEKAAAVAASATNIAEMQAELDHARAEHAALVTGIPVPAPYQPVAYSADEIGHFKALLRQNIGWFIAEEDYKRMGKTDAERAILNP